MSSKICAINEKISDFVRNCHKHPFPLQIAMDDEKKIVDLIYNTEKIADKILVNKQEIVNYDKKRQGNREALREMKKSTEKKIWITVGSMLIEMERTEAVKVIEKGAKLIGHDF